MDIRAIITSALNSTEADIATRRGRIADKLASGVGIEAMTHELASLAHSEGAARVFQAAADMLAEGQDIEVVYTRLVYQFLLRTDDTWSGRGNDLRRATADGHRDALSDLQRYIDVHR